MIRLLDVLFEPEGLILMSILTLLCTIIFAFVSIVLNALYVYYAFPSLFWKQIKDTGTDITGVPDIVESELNHL